MYNRQRVFDMLERIEESISDVQQWTEHITGPDDFYASSTGMILLNAVCMKLLAVGEEVKSLDRRTNGNLLSHYSSIPWKQVMGLRDIIAHHYFEVDASEICTIIQTDLPPLLQVVQQMKEDIMEQE